MKKAVVEVDIIGWYIDRVTPHTQVGVERLLIIIYC